MQIKLSPEAKEDLDYWRKCGNKKILKRIEVLIRSIAETPYQGIGKPEALKHNLAGYWSRRITQVHRMVYKAEGMKL